MNRQSVKKIPLFLILLFSSTFSCFAFKQTKKVKVGYSSIPGFSETDSVTQEKKGYSYEYLQKLASFTGWEYEYVYGEWSILYQKLMDGEIDILPQVVKSPEKESKILFSENEMGLGDYYLFIPDSQYNSIIPGNLSSLNGKKTGVLKNSVQEQTFLKWCSDNNIDCQPVELNGEESILNQLYSSQIDAAVLPDNCLAEKIIPLYKIGSNRFHFGVNKNRPDLLKELNNAQEYIFQKDHYYNETLQRKYFSNSATKKVLDTTELNWILSQTEINVGYIDNYLPYCTTTVTDGKKEMTGLFRVLLDNISNQYGITFNCIGYNSSENLINDLQKREIDVLLPAYADLWRAEKNNFLLTKEIVNAQMTLLYNGIYSEGTMKSIAITDQLPIQKAYAESKYPSSFLITYPDFNSCLNAVIKGEASCTIINNSVLGGYRKQYKKISRFTSSDILQSFSTCMAVRRENTELLSILNKGIQLVDENTLNEALIRYSQTSIEYSLMDFISDNIILLIIILCLLVITVLFAAKKIKELIRENRNANFDTLTRLLNRRSMNKYLGNAIKNAIDVNRLFSFLMFDIDNFKKVNDTYGHECGDEILKAISLIITKGIRDEDYAFRWGGEEILVLLSAEGDVAAKVADRIRERIETNVVNYRGTEVKVTVTVGVSTYRPGLSIPDMLEKADSNLYEGKRTGKNKVVFEE